MSDATLQASLSAIDDFIESLFLEDGLSANTLQAYRRDLTACAQFLAQTDAACTLDAAQESHLQAFLQARHVQGVKAVSSNRGLSVLRRYFHWGLRERRIQSDPTVRLLAAKKPLRVPHTLTQAQVEALLLAPDVTTPLGLRDRAMLELMYASGLRVSELVGLADAPSGHSGRRAAHRGQGPQGAVGAVWRGSAGLAAALSAGGPCRHPAWPKHE